MALPEIYHVSTKERHVPGFLLFRIQMIKWGWPEIPKRLQRWETGGGGRIPLGTKHIKMVHRLSSEETSWRLRQGRNSRGLDSQVLILFSAKSNN